MHAPSAAAPQPGARPPSSWPLYATRVAVGLSFAAVLGLLWILHRQELEDHRADLIRDVLWVEQNVQFNLDRDVARLRQLTQDLPGADQAQLELRAKHLLPSSPGLLEVVLLDAGGRLRASAPAPERIRPGAPWVEPRAETAWRLACSTGRAAYAPPAPAAGDTQFEVFVPYYQGGALAGTAVGIYGLKAILSGVIPWWLTEKYRLTLRDGSGNVLASKSNVEATRPALTWQVALEPPGHGLILHVESYGSQTKLVRNLLTAVIFTLAGVLLLNLRSLRTHVRRRVATEKALQEEHAFRKAMEDSIHTGMCAVDLAGRIVYVNPAFCKMVGYSDAELVGHASPQEFWPTEDRGRIDLALRTARAAGTPDVGIELNLVRRSGERFDVLLYEAPLIDARGQQAGWMGSAVDITERKRAREETRRQEERVSASARLVTMGEMASAIAHELNQPLSAIASYTAGCLNLLDAGPRPANDLREALQKTAQQAERAGRIIRRVHAFVRKSEPTRTAVRINAVVAEAVDFAEAEARKRRVKIATRLSADDPELQADPLLLQQVLLNLLRNGMDAMSATPPEERRILVTTERTGQLLLVGVEDRGCGLTPEVKERLFDPFFSTKAEGMGMGLNICRSIMELHRGRVWAEPGPEGGTAFFLALPVEAA